MAQVYSSEQRGQIESSAPVFSANGLLIGVLIVAILYFGRDVFVPIALSILLSFVLAIPVGVLQRWAVPRSISVAIVVVLAFGAIFSVGAVLTSQLAQLAGDLPRYQSTIRDKVASLKNTTSGHGPLERVADMIQDLSNEIAPGTPPERPQVGQGSKPGAAGGGGEGQKPVPVEIVGGPTGALSTISAYLSPLLRPLETTVLVAVFVIFILLQRGDLRNRLIRLAGSHDLQRTTAAMNDAASRLSRFFLVQVLINSGFGMIVGTGLWLIGVPSPVLWGIIAAFSRFVPYVGIVLAAGCPVLLSAAVDPNWTMVAETAAMFLAIELVVAQAVEPLLYGHSTGLSPVAVVVSVTFWAWLWGGIGLLLATPLTVCLVVLGRHVEHLTFLDVMLGDRPALTPAETFYQRMLAGDVAEGAEQAHVFLKDHALATFYDEVALRGLALAQLDTGRGVLDPKRLATVERSICELIEDLDDRPLDPPDTDAKQDRQSEDVTDLDRAHDTADCQARRLSALRGDELLSEWSTGAAVLCVAGRNQLDRASAGMVRQLLEKHGIAAEAETADVLGSAHAGVTDPSTVRVVCLCFLDTSSPVQVRFAVRRARRKFPNATILGGLWTMEPDAAKELCETAEVDLCAGRLVEAVDLCLGMARGGTAQPPSAAAPAAGTAARSLEQVDPALFA